jgi:hypothetical protein
MGQDGAVRRCPLALAAVLAATFAAAACSGGDSDDGGNDSEPATSEAPALDPTCDLHGTGTFARRSTRASELPAFLEGVEVAPEGCLDRVAFEFESPGVGAGLPPGYVAEYRPGPFFRGEGDEQQELDIAGTAFLVVSIEPAARSVPGEEGEVLTYTGPTDFVPGNMEHLEEMMLVVDGDGRLEWVIGLDSERPFLVDSAAGPPRIIVKIA